MTTSALFSIRRLLAMVAVIACSFAALRYANSTTVLVLQTLVLGTAVVMSVLAMAGGARTRRFCIAALTAGAMHWFVCSAAPLSIYGMDTESSPTAYCCYVLWNWTKVAMPVSIPTYGTPPGVTYYVAPSSYPPPPSSYYAPSTTYQPPGGFSFPPPSGFSSTPTPATSQGDTPDGLVADLDASAATPASRLVPVAPPAVTIVPPPGAGETAPIDFDSTTVPAVRVAPQTAGSPNLSNTPASSVTYGPSVIVPSGNISPPTFVMPALFKPDWPTFAKVGILDATLLIGLIAGCAAVMLDEWRRREIRGRSAVKAIVEN